MKYKYTKAVYMNNGDYNGRVYRFITLDEDIKVDDLVVVETRGGYQVVKVTGFSNTADSDVTRHVVQSLDLDSFEEKKEKIKKREDIRKSIEERISKINYIKRLEKFAEEDEGIATLLKELKELES